MYTILVILHIIVSFTLIVIVLLQKGKGADVGAAFGGASQTIFGSRGAASFLSKVTTGAAVIFMITSLSLAVISAKRGSVIMKMKQPSSVSHPETQGQTGPIKESPAGQQAAPAEIPAQK